MAEKSKIGWTDSTLNFWSGCTKVSAGCAHCYAEARDARMLQEKVIHFGKGAPRLKSKSSVKEAFKMNAKPWICDECGKSWKPLKWGLAQDDSPSDNACCGTGYHRRRIFSLSLGDWLDKDVPIEWLAEMLDTIRQCDQVTWILCSKRWEGWLMRMCSVIQHIHPSPESEVSELYHWLMDWRTEVKVPSNIIGLCSVENQEQADKRIPQFLTVPLACRGLSLEPLLGPVELYYMWTWGKSRKQNKSLINAAKIDWLIIGGESGPKAREFNLDWGRRLIEQGRAAGVPVFMKQLGQNPVGLLEPLGEDRELSGASLKDKKGADPAEWPAEMRVQQWLKGF